MTSDDMTNYQNSPLPGCDPAAELLSDFLAEVRREERVYGAATPTELAELNARGLGQLIERLALELDQVPTATNLGGHYLIREIKDVLERGRDGSTPAIERAVRMIRALAELWGFRRGGSFTDAGFMFMADLALGCDRWELTQKGEAVTARPRDVARRQQLEAAAVRMLDPADEHPSAGYFRRTGPTPMHDGGLGDCDLPECRNVVAILREEQRVTASGKPAEQPPREPDGPEDDDPFPLTDAGQGC